MINFISVSKQFGDQSYGLKDISFSVGAGELVLITGPSGSGKTTIMKLLTKEYVPTTGEIEFQGEPLSKIKSGQVHQHRRQIGVVFQDYKLLPEMNVWENIALSLNIIGKPEAEIESRVTDLLQLIQLTDKAFLFPTQLSGGEAQRVSIARALAAAPAVIFADEPTGNLDPETSTAIARLLHKINELGTTILLATHDQGVVQVLNKHRMIRLEKGKLVHDSHASTTPTPAKTEPKVEPEAKVEPETKIEVEPKVELKVETEPQAEPDLKVEKNLQPEPTLPPEIKTKKRLSLPKLWPFSKKKTVEIESNTKSETKIDQPFDQEFQVLTKVEVEVEDIDSNE
jgi:cell division transport system ATP-binding protein